MTAEELQEKSEKIYPMPVKPCAWMKARVLWLRERWIKSQIKGI